MKKLLAVLLSAVLVFGSLACGIVLTTAGEAETTPLIFDFTTQDCYDGSIEYTTVGGTAGTYTRPVYNATEQAMEITFSSKTNRENFNITCLNEAAALAASKYEAPVVAIRAKSTARATGFLTSPWMLTGSTQYDGRTKFRPQTFGITAYGSNTSATVGTTTYFQMQNYYTAVSQYNFYQAQVDGKVKGQESYPTLSQSWDDVEWKGVNWEFSNRNATGTEVNLTIYVQWIGIFESAEALAAYEAGSVCLKEETEEPEEETTPLIFDFTTQDCYDGSMEYTSVTGTVTSYGYDATNKALKVSFDSPNRQSFIISSINDAAKTAANEYLSPVIAIRYKFDTTPGLFLSKPRLNTAIAYDGKTAFLPNGYGANAHGNVSININQTVSTTATTSAIKGLFDGSLVANQENYPEMVAAWDSVEWNGVSWEFNNRANAQNTGNMYIEMIGFFESKAAAEAYVNGSVCLKKYLETDGAVCNQSKDSLAFRFKMTANGVGYADPAAAAANTNFSRAALDGATMVVDGAERAVTDYGVLLSTVAGTDNTTLTAEAVTGAKIRKIPAAVLYDAGTGWVQFAVLVKNITAHADNEVFARAYVEYTDANGNTAYTYSDIISTTLNEAIKEVG